MKTVDEIALAAAKEIDDLYVRHQRNRTQLLARIQLVISKAIAEAIDQRT